MAVQPFSEIPRSLTAGDSLALLLSANDFPADQGWALNIKAVVPNSNSSIDLGPSVASGSQHSITVLASETAAWTPGAYRWQMRASKGTEVYTLDDGQLMIVAALDVNQESRTFEERMLEQIEAALLALGSSNIIEYRIGDRQARRYTRMELLKERSYYRTVIRRQRGEPIIRLIPTEFTSGQTSFPGGGLV